MKNYKYGFVNETKTIEISEEWICVLKELDRREYNNNHAETRRHVSLSHGDDGKWLSTDQGDTFIRCAGIVFYQDDIRFEKAIKKLTAKQKALYEAVYVRGVPLKEYAEDTGISPAAATKLNKHVIKKFEEFFKKG